MALAEPVLTLPGDWRLLASRHPLTGRIARRLRDRCGVPAGATVVLGVSGGADSVALLLACGALRQRSEVRPIVGHVNHQLRPCAADDAAFVESLCAVMDVPCETRLVAPATRGGNLASAARTCRYEALAAIAHEHAAAHVVVAHHADDQFETMLMALCRGSSLDGLSGMSWRTPLRDSISLIRPLLDSTHAECEHLCRAVGVPWRDDPANASRDTARGRLRAEVVPVLESMWPGGAARATMAADSIALARTLLGREVEHHFGPATKREWTRASLRQLPALVIAAGLRRSALACDPGMADQLGQTQLLDAAEAIRDDVERPRTFDWPTGLTLRISARDVRLL